MVAAVDTGTAYEDRSVKDDTPKHVPTVSPGAKARRADALRANLKRRKTQAEARRDGNKSGDTPSSQSQTEVTKD